MAKISTDLFFNIYPVLSHSELLWYILLGARGMGKSFQVKKLFIKDFLEKGEQFAFICRRQEELALSAPKYFNDQKLYEMFPDLEIEYTGGDNGSFLINGEVAGYGFPLSQAIKYKKIEYPGITKGVYEEGVADPLEGGRYLKNEPEVLASLCSSIFRDRDYKMFILGNFVTINNPWVIKFKLYPKTDNERIIKNKTGAVGLFILPNKKGFEEAYLQTSNGKIQNALGTTDFNIYNRPR